MSNGSASLTDDSIVEAMAITLYLSTHGCTGTLSLPIPWEETSDGSRGTWLTVARDIVSFLDNWCLDNAH